MFIGTSFKIRGPSFLFMVLLFIGALAMVYSAVLIGALVVGTLSVAYVAVKVYRDEVEKRRNAQNQNG